MSDILVILKTWNKIDCVKFAVWCAEKVISGWREIYPDDQRPQLAIMAVKNWVDNPTKENERLACHASLAAGRAEAEAANRNLSNNVHYIARAVSDAAAAVWRSSAYTYIYAGNTALWTERALNNGIRERDLLGEYLGSNT